MQSFDHVLRPSNTRSAGPKQSARSNYAGSPLCAILKSNWTSNGTLHEKSS
jgi:hypothetical protein